MSAWLEEQSWLMDYKPTAETAGCVVGMHLVMCNKRFHLSHTSVQQSSVHNMSLTSLWFLQLVFWHLLCTF